MIPNQIKFDLNLQDLPARASHISSEVLNLSGGYCESGKEDGPIAYEDIDLGYQAKRESWSNGQLSDHCEWQCKQIGFNLRSYAPQGLFDDNSDSRNSFCRCVEYFNCYL